MRFKNATLLISLATVVLSSALTSIALAAESAIFNASVATSSLTVRTGPGTSYRKDGGLTSGTVVQVYEQKNGWDRIAANQWVAGEYLKKSSTVVTAKTFNAAVTISALIVRTGPGKKYNRTDQLSKGEVVKVLEQKNGWYRVAADQWVLGQYLKKTAAAVKVARQTAKVSTALATNDTAVVPAAAAPEDVPGSLDDGAAPAATPSAEAEPTNLNTTCLAAIKQANSYCLSVAKGCNSYSKTPRCLEANQSCADHQTAALALCPAAH